MEVHPLYIDEQRSLGTALSSRDINSFRVESPTEVEKTEVDTSMTIFERACQTPGCGKFIEKCLLAGCDVNKLNPYFNKRPINFAVESHSQENLLALLQDPNIDINSPCPMYSTPINTLAEQITDVNFRNVFPCIQILIQQCADINLPNQNGMTPIMNILKNRNLNVENKKMVIKYILQNAIDVDLDVETKALLNETLPYIDVEYDTLKINDDNRIALTSSKLWNFNRLYHALKNKKEDEFLAGIEQISKNSPEIMNVLLTATERQETLLIAAISKDLSEATQKLIDLGANVNYSIPTEKDDPLCPLKSAVIRGHWKCLATLLKSPDIDVNAVPSLPIVAKFLGRKFTKDRNFEKCFDLLLNHHDIDVNQYDSSNCTALHYSVQCRNSEVIHELLKKGAYFGVQNKLGQLAITDIDAKVLEKHLNSCITTNGLRPSDEDYEIAFNYKNFIPRKKNEEKKSKENHKKRVTQKKGRKIDTTVNEMAAIAAMSESEDIKDLVMHPLIQSYTSLRWRRLGLFFWWNFVLCTIWSLSTIAYILFYYNNHIKNEIAYCLMAVTFLMTMYVIIREISQFIFSPRVYVTSMDNYVECTLVVLVMLILFDMYSEEWRRTFAASTILLIAVEFFLICGSLPFWSFSSHYVMLTKVAVSFIKSLSLYSIILVAFALSFYTLINEPSNQPKESNSNGDNDDDDDDDDFNNFPSIHMALVKTFVMAAGEFDAADINFGVNKFSTAVFIVFILLVSIVLLNLLTGLAVSDTQVIKMEAEQTDFIRHVHVLALYNSRMLRMFTWASRRFDALSSIRVRPNMYNLILAPDFDSNSGEKNDYSKSLRAVMDPKIVRAAREIVEKHSAGEQDECGIGELKERIIKMETMLKIIADKLNELVRKRRE